MNYKTLNIKHSCWDGEQCAKHEALYKAGKHFNNLISQFLLKNPTEQQQVYERRKKEAFYTGYVAEIVNSTLFCSNRESIFVVTPFPYLYASVVPSSSYSVNVEFP